jgi:Alpha-kinase family
VNAHIGAIALHAMCYNVVAPLWRRWSHGHNVLQEHTKLRAALKFAEISGDVDAIWMYFLKKKRQQGGTRKAIKDPKSQPFLEFDPSKELDIFVVIDDDDYKDGEFMRECKRGDPDYAGRHNDYSDSIPQTLPPSNVMRRSMTVRSNNRSSTNTTSMTTPASSCSYTTRNTTPNYSERSVSMPAPIDILESILRKRRRSDTTLSVRLLLCSYPEVRYLTTISSYLWQTSSSSIEEQQPEESELPSFKTPSLPGASPSKRIIPSKTFISPDRDGFAAALREQQGAAAREIVPIIHQVSLLCTFYEIPVRAFDYDNITKDRAYDLDDLPKYSGTLTFNTSPHSSATGAFKTSHVGSVNLIGDMTLFPFTGTKVCVKQTYYKDRNGTIRRHSGAQALELILEECRCLDWATSLLQLAYDFIDRELHTLGAPTEFDIPEVRFVRALLAYSSVEKKAFLVEEWMDISESSPFIKYINNAMPVSCVRPTAPPELHDIAEFLCFIQHVQWSKTKYQSFASDYQGVEGLLTDPQILTSGFVNSLPVQFVTA